MSWVRARVGVEVWVGLRVGFWVIEWLALRRDVSSARTGGHCWASSSNILGSRVGVVVGIGIGIGIGERVRG